MQWLQVAEKYPVITSVVKPSFVDVTCNVCEHIRSVYDLV